MKNEEFEHLLSDLEVRLERLRSLYEQYFIGIEKLEPGVARKDVDRRFWDLRKIRVRNTALRFRLQTLIQRYNTLQQYWVRICRQIENGTYVRQLRKAARTGDAKAAPTPELAQAVPLVAAAAASELSRAAAPASELSRDPVQAPQSEVSRDRVAALHAELSAVRKGLQQGNVSVESVEKRIRDTEAQLREKHPGRAIDFRVEIKDGKAVIKPFIRR